ncbi:MAG: SGNH/GDSL hydrolase family protein [Owenweeksia sp.]
MLRNTIIILCLMLMACRPDDKADLKPVHPGNNTKGKAISYLALGDSYTIGTAIGTENSYASRLADSLKLHDSIRSVKLDIIAQNGWTTGNLLNALNNETIPTDYDMVTLLIGVNNQYQGRSKVVYRNEFTTLLQQAIQYAGGDAGKVIVLSIPDWGATPAGAANRTVIAADIDDFNSINKAVTDSMKVAYLDITPVSRTAADNPELVAADNLHFSAEMHELWLKMLYAPAVSALLP